MSADSISEDQLSRALANARADFESGNFREAEGAVSGILESRSECHEAWFLLSHIKAARRLLGNQVECLERAIELEPTNCEYMAHLALARLGQGRLDEAAGLAMETWPEARRHVEVLKLLGEIFHSVGKYQQSVQAYRESIALADSDAGSHYGLGVSLALCGHIADARDTYHRAIERDPGHVKAWSALSKIRQATRKDNHIECLTKLVKTTRNPWLAINIHHGLAKELDDLGRYQEAFAALEEGKRRLRVQCPHDPFGSARKVDELSGFYAGLDSDAERSFGYRDDSPVFVVGMPRSGTTVVERVLSNHPDVVAIGERPQFSLLLKSHCNRPGTGIIECDALARAWPSLDWRDFGMRYLQSVRYLSGSNGRFVDKLPLNVLYAGAILTALPDARIVCLLRDPCDTVIGNYRQVFEQTTGLYAWTLDLEATARFTVAFTRLVETLRRQFPDQFHVVSYEKLITDPIEQAQEMFNFCKLDWHDSYVAIQENSSPVGSASTSQVQEPIHGRYARRSDNYSFCLDGVKSIFRENGIEFRTDQNDCL